MCKDVVLTLQELTIVESFLPFELGSTDVVLGMQWFRYVGRMEVDWYYLEMWITMGTVKVTLKGDPSLRRSGISLKAMVQRVRKATQGYY